MTRSILLSPKHRRFLSFLLSLTFIFQPRLHADVVTAPLAPQQSGNITAIPIKDGKDTGGPSKTFRSDKPYSMLPETTVTEFKVKFVGGDEFTYSETKEKYLALKSKSETHIGIECSQNAADKATTAGINMATNSNDANAQGEKIQSQSTQAGAQAAAFQATCSVENAELIAEGEELKSTLGRERGACIGQAAMDAEKICQSNCSGYIDFGACLNSCKLGALKANNNACDKVKVAVEDKTMTLMGLLKNHWGKMLALLGVITGGLAMLGSSGDKQKQDFLTDPTGGKKKRPEQERSKEEQQTLSTHAEPQQAQISQSPADQAYCKSSAKPLECFVTPACDLKCVSGKYGVPNYTGMSNDPTRIDPNGNVVENSTAGSNSNLSGSGGGNSSGGGTGDLSVNSETGTSGQTDPDNPNASTFGQGSDDYGGGSSGTFGDPSDRNPANDRYNGQGIMVNGRNVDPKDPAATGPLQPISSDLFRSVRNTTRAQCVREAVKCP